MSPSSSVGGSRVLVDEPELSVLLLIDDCLVQTPSADIVLCVLDRGEGAGVGCDRMEAIDDVRESAIDESRRVSGDGESSSSLYARVDVNIQGQCNRGRNIYIPITPP